MSNQTAAVIGVIANAVNWEREDLDLQAVIRAGNQGRLGVPLTDWLVSRGWNQGKFVVIDKFVVDISGKARVKILRLSRRFQDWFLNVVEDLPSATKLVPTIVLTSHAFDSDIIAALRDVTKSIVSLGEIFALMESQPDGPKSGPGPLLTNEFSNIFLVPQAVKKIDATHFSYTDSAGTAILGEPIDPQFLFEVNGKWYVLRVVHVVWYRGGWVVDAESVGGPGGWWPGNRVFTRNPLKSLEPSASAA